MTWLLDVSVLRAGEDPGDLLRLRLDDALQSLLPETKILEVLESESPGLLPPLPIRGDDALDIAIMFDPDLIQI